jgi:hypothetical protein
MASRRKWIWIIVAVCSVMLIALFVIAGVGVYFVSQNIHASRSSSTDAVRAFEEVRMKFKEQRPLFELDSAHNPRVARSTSDIPTSPNKPEHLWILAWDTDEERLVKVSLPFWLLRMGKRKVDLFNSDSGFDLERLQLDVQELERIGPALVFDFRAKSGERVLVWTQ